MCVCVLTGVDFVCRNDAPPAAPALSPLVPWEQLGAVPPHLSRTPATALVPRQAAAPSALPASDWTPGASPAAGVFVLISKF